MYILSYKLFEKKIDYNKNVFNDLNKSKRKHSKRVAKLVSELTHDNEVIKSAYYHDYIENVGNYDKISKVLSPKSLLLVRILTHDSDTDVFQDIVSKINNTNDINIIEDIITLKICDRVDNLISKNKRGRLTKSYIRKSVKLLYYLYTLSNNKNNLRTFLCKYLNEIPKLIKKLF